MAQQAVLDAAIEFCERSMALTLDLDPIAVEPDVAEYALDVPMGTRLGVILGVWLDETKLIPIPSLQTRRNTDTGVPSHYSTVLLDEITQLRVFPAPNTSATGNFYVRATVVPLRSATTLMSPLYEDWVDAIIAGAQARIKMTPGQSFTDAQAGLLHERRFRNLCSQVRADVNHGRVVASLTVQPRSL